MAASKNGIENAIRADVARAARALMGWTPQELADKSGVPLRTIARLELGEGGSHKRTLAAIRSALEAAGVEFIPENGGGPGVRLRRPTLHNY